MTDSKIRWGLVITTAVIAAAVIAGVFFAWYYSKVFISYQQSAAERARAEAVEAQLRQKYCTGGPYEIEVIRKFCTGR